MDIGDDDLEGEATSSYRFDRMCDPGRYPGKIAECEDYVSKSSGEDCFQALIDFDTPAGGVRVRKYVTKGGPLREFLAAMFPGVKDIRAAIATKAKAAGGKVSIDPSQFVGRALVGELYVEKDKNGEYPDKMACGGVFAPGTPAGASKPTGGAAKKPAKPFGGKKQEPAPARAPAPEDRGDAYEGDAEDELPF